ncbi:unnamed protein product [Rotaria sordida]|uniref:Uncharacterized protein n=1 Tax=Rotaria sordida TaxID=392033 RepID=A0A819U7B8_9BILA|nr:unnamed protein product [Rotaria sordida]
MDAIKAGIEKAKETVQGKKAEEEARKASDPTVKPSERVDAAVEYGKAKMKEAEHAFLFILIPAQMFIDFTS